MVDEQKTAEKMAVDAKRYMDAVRKAKMSIARLEKDRDEMRSLIDGLKAVRYDRDGGGSAMLHGDDAVFGVICRLEEVERGVVERSSNYACVLDSWEDTCEAMDADDVRLLEMHYIELVPWERVAVSLSYSERSVYYHRWSALCSMYWAMPSEYRR